MDELNLPEGYSLENQTLERRVGKEKFHIEYTILRKEGKIVLALPTEHCPPQRIDEVIKQTKEN